MNTEENKRTRCGCNNWSMMSGVLCDKRVPSHVKGKIHNNRSASTQVKKLEVTDMNMCRWTCSHTLRDHVRNGYIRERLKVETSQRGASKQACGGLDESRGETKNTSEKRLEMVPFTWEKKARKIEAEMDGLCQRGHESHRNDKR